MPRKVAFRCPDCDAPAWLARRGGNRTSPDADRRRVRQCRGCGRKMVTLQPAGEPERFVRWIVEATPEMERTYARLRWALVLADAPPALFDALARAGRKVGVRDLMGVDV